MQWLVIIAMFVVTQQPVRAQQGDRTAESNSTQSAAHAKSTRSSPTPSAQSGPVPTQAPAATESQRSTATHSDHAGTSSQGTSDEDRATQRKLTWFTGILATVGVLQLVVMFLTWLIYGRQAREMRRQRHEMRQQRHIMWRQWKSMGVQAEHMKGQIAEIAAQSGILKESVAVARAAAKAAQDGANAAKESADATRDSVDTFISKERARLRIVVKPYDADPRQVANIVRYSVHFHGKADAFVSESAAYAVISASSIPDIDDERAGIFKISLPDVIGPATHIVPEHMVFAYADKGFPTSSLASAINEAKLFVHFYAFIKYRTLESNRETRVCLTWDVNLALNALLPSNTRGDHWEKRGPPEANRET